jgi:hypothetical protein
MSSLDTYQARAVAARARELADTASPFTIEVRFLGGLTETQQEAFTLAADRWARMIVGDLPAVVVDGEEIDDVLILAQGSDIDGPGMVLGQAGPTHLRPANAGPAAMIPAKGLMSFDSADLASMEREGTLNDVITHEMGHVLGIGTIWDRKGLLHGPDTDDPTFAGAGAIAEYRALRPADGAGEVPVENTGGAGTRNSHWREAVFGNELMSGFIAAPGNPISRITVASLGDLGYEVDLDAAEPYSVPSLVDVVERGALVRQRRPVDHGVVLPVTPALLPEESLGAST